MHTSLGPIEHELWSESFPLCNEPLEHHSFNWGQTLLGGGLLIARPPSAPVLRRHRLERRRLVRLVVSEVILEAGKAHLVVPPEVLRAGQQMANATLGIAVLAARDEPERGDLAPFIVGRDVERSGGQM